MSDIGYCIEWPKGSGKWVGYGTLEQARRVRAEGVRLGRDPGPVHHKINTARGFWGVGKPVKRSKK